MLIVLKTKKKANGKKKMTSSTLPAIHLDFVTYAIAQKCKQHLLPNRVSPVVSLRNVRPHLEHEVYAPAFNYTDSLGNSFNASSASSPEISTSHTNYILQAQVRPSILE